MFNLFKSLFSGPKKEMKYAPLQVAESAKARIDQQVSSRPEGIESMFEIRIDFKKDSYKVKVGFVERKEINTVFQYPIPLSIGKTEEEFLQNFTLEYDEEKESFFIYPDVHISVEETPNPSILKLEINRIVVHESSESTRITLLKNEERKFKNILLDKLFNLGFIESIQIEDNVISLEFGIIPSQDIEEKTVDTVLKYFTDLGYPLGIRNGNVQTLIPG